VSDRSQTGSAYAVAETSDDESDDVNNRNLEAARAVRRALAGARLKARDVDLVFVVCLDPVPCGARQRCRRTIEVALGRYADRPAVRYCRPVGSAEASVARIENHARRAVSTGRARAALAVAVGFGGVNRAVVFGIE
jgi:hypothetical protein